MIDWDERKLPVPDDQAHRYRADKSANQTFDGLIGRDRRRQSVFPEQFADPHRSSISNPENTKQQ